MTAELARASYDDSPPFHGDTCVVRNLNLELLWNCYKTAVALLAEVGTYESYLDNQDWHWHDGIITRSGVLPATEWATWLESPEALAKAWRAEDYCHYTVYPPDLKWCLRFHIWEDMENQGNECGLDLSGDPELIARFAAEIKDKHGVGSIISMSSDWFLRSGHTQNSPEALAFYFKDSSVEPVPKAEPS